MWIDAIECIGLDWNWCLDYNREIDLKLCRFSKPQALQYRVRAGNLGSGSSKIERGICKGFEAEANVC